MSGDQSITGLVSFFGVFSSSHGFKRSYGWFETYHLLGLRTYFTAGEKEVRAWTIHAGDTAPKAAGVIHSDFERGFIKAETVAYKDLVACGSVAAAREKGLYRMEGKEYVVADGDVLLFKFNV